MSITVLPNSINYDEQLASLMPNVNNYTQTIQSSNGSSFKPSSQIIFDIPSRGFIDPKSIYLRYKNTYTATNAGAVCKCPLYTPFQRLDIFVNSQLFDTIPDYNIVANNWIDLNLGANEKMSIQSAWGYNATDGNVTKFDSRSLSAGGNTFSVAGPLVANALVNSEKFFPAFAVGGIRLVFTLDTVVNMCSNSTIPTDFTLFNCELVFDMVDFGPEVEREILARDSIVIKSNSYNLTSVNVPAGTNGTNQFVFNQRFASIRSAIVGTTSATTAVQVNGKYDSVDLTSYTDSSLYGGYYSLNCGGVIYPQGGPLNTLNNRNGLLMELRKATGNIYDWSKAMSIDVYEFGFAESGATGAFGTALAQTSVTEPGKFFVGFDLNKINSASNMMLNGTSSQNSPINVIVSQSNATANSHNLYLMLNYDVILTIDPRTKQLNILQ